MGLLSQGTPLDWPDARPLADHVRKHGIIQLINIFERMRSRQHDSLMWGDEVECMLIEYDDVNRRARLSIRAGDIIEEMMEVEKKLLEANKPVEVLWRPEFARYMLEGTPGAPYGPQVRDLLLVEQNMRQRRETVRERLRSNESLLTITTFPLLGSGNFVTPSFAAGGAAAHSLFVPDEIINLHPRFKTLASNIRQRRQAKVAINLPIFVDEKTPRPFKETFPASQWPDGGADAAKEDHIYMDAMCFGMGNCCLQVTFQACNVAEARSIYDQLVPVTPIMLALSAGAPIWRGYLADVDCRWSVIAASVDDRTPEERGLAPLSTSRYVISKSRYDSVDSYLSVLDEAKDREYNDVPLVVDEDIVKTLMDAGFDSAMARHFAHLFIRDPLVIYRELVDQDDQRSSDHFENIQSTNWQTMRFKPPPPNSPIGWRVEFRPMETQFTDFENAAYSVFVVLLSRAILSFELDLYMPISLVDNNLEKAQKRDAVLSQKFAFRTEVKRGGSSATEMLTVDEIVNGVSTPTYNFIGLVPLVHVYLDSINTDVNSRCNINRYLELVSRRASGALMTNAAWIRNFVKEHPLYKRDSVVSEEINYDLMKAIDKISSGQQKCPELWATLNNKPEDA